MDQLKSLADDPGDGARSMHNLTILRIISLVI
jgi:hypothetical protein